MYCRHLLFYLLLRALLTTFCVQMFHIFYLYLFLLPHVISYICYLCCAWCWYCSIVLLPSTQRVNTIWSTCMRKDSRCWLSLRFLTGSIVVVNERNLLWSNIWYQRLIKMLHTLFTLVPISGHFRAHQGADVFIVFLKPCSAWCCGDIQQWIWGILQHFLHYKCVKNGFWSRFLP